MDMTDKIPRMADRVAFFVLAEGQPEDPLFDAAFSALRQRSREFKDKQEQAAQESLQKSLSKDLTEKGYGSVGVQLSLGKYRGSRFVTSAKVHVIVKDEKDAKELAKYLQRYHPNYHLKSFDPETKIAEFNIR